MERPTASTAEDRARARRHATLIVVVAVAVRLMLAAVAFAVHGNAGAFHTEDTARYLDLASHLRHGSFATADGPETYRPPAFPALVAVVSLAGAPTAATIAANALLGGLTTLLVMGAARRLAGDGAAVGAGLFTALEPGLVIWSTVVLTETLAAALVAGLMAALVRFAQRPGAAVWILVAVACAIASAYTRVVAYFLPPLVAFLPLLIGGEGWRRRVTQTAAGLALVVVLVGAWHIRNSVIAGYPGFSTQITRAALYGTAVGVRVVATSGDVLDARRESAARIGADEQDTVGDRMRGTAMLREAWRTMTDNPGALALLTIRGVATNLVHPAAFRWLALFGATETPTGASVTASSAFVKDGAWGLADAWRQVSVVRRAIATALVAILMAYYAAAIAGWRALRPRSLRWCLAALFLYFIVLSSGPYASGRFRAPVMPVIALLAGVGTTAAVRPRDDRQPSAAPADVAR